MSAEIGFTFEPDELRNNFPDSYGPQAMIPVRFLAALSLGGGAVSNIKPSIGPKSRDRLETFGGTNFSDELGGDSGANALDFGQVVDVNGFLLEHLGDSFERLFLKHLELLKDLFGNSRIVAKFFVGPNAIGHSHPLVLNCPELTNDEVKAGDVVGDSVVLVVAPLAPGGEVFGTFVPVVTVKVMDVSGFVFGTLPARNFSVFLSE